MFSNATKKVPLNGIGSRLHRWDSSISGRGPYTPHMKCYFSYQNLTRSNNDKKYDGNNDNNKNVKLNWFLLTSANLSQAAWGVSENNCSQLYIKSFELGVLFLPRYVLICFQMYISIIKSHV
jgi:tyrosyl-DNA phosphodiesterase-1